ncbi:amidohydrolase family protein [Kaarinaea lacus]
MAKGQNAPGKPVSIFRLLRSIGLFRILVFLSFPLALLVIAFWETTHEPPIFDAQVHYNQESWHKVSPEAVLNTARELNVPWLLVGSTPNEGTWKLEDTGKPRIIRMLIPQHTPEDRDTWFRDERMINYMDQEIARGGYSGIGEFFLFDGQVNTPVVRHMVELATNQNLVLHARSDPKAIEQLFAMGPKLRILWAHAGMFTRPEKVGELLNRYPGLWVEISHRGDVAPNGVLDPRWRELLLRFPSRFLLGSGTYRNEYWYQFRYIHTQYRDWLKELPPGPRKKIAYQNGLNLFRLL